MKYKIFIAVYIILLGMIPLLWFKGDYLITGTDVNFSPFPSERLQNRIYTWETNVLTGTPKTPNIASLTFIATSGLLNKIMGNVQLIEKITFVTWFAFTGFSISFLLEKVFYDFKEKERFLVKIFGILLYMVNFYTVFQWVRLHLNITTLVFLPILFGVLYDVFARNKTNRTDLLILAIATILGGSLGLQPPLIYVFIMTMIVFISFYSLFDIGKWKLLLSKFKKFALVSLVVISSGAYWIFPQAYFIFNSDLVKKSGFGEEIYDVHKLLGWTSKTTSNLNILRNFGDVVWFDSWGERAYFPEFLKFYSNPIFIALSFLLLFTIFLPFYSGRKKKTITAFGLIAITSAFFSKGLHPPFSGLFEWAFNNLPAFWIHRAPWQKFGMALTLSYTMLGSYGFYLVVKYLSKRMKLSKTLLTISIIIVYITYHHLFFLGKMFPSKESEVGYHGHYNLGFHHKFPEYLYDLREYFAENENENDFNTLLLPDLKTNVYDWGYAGSVDIVSIFTNKPTLYRLYGEGYYLDGYISNIYNDLILTLYNKSLPELSEVFDFYGIKYVLQRNDFTYGFYGDTDSPKFIKEILSNVIQGEPKVFGKWDLYKVGGRENYPLVTTGNYIVDVSQLRKSLLLPVLGAENKEKLLTVDRIDVPLEYNETYISAVINTKNKLEYSVEIEKEGMYELLLLTPEYSTIDTQKYEITITNPKYPTKKIEAGENILKYSFEKGKYDINLEGPLKEKLGLEHRQVSRQEFLNAITLFENSNSLIDALNKTVFENVQAYEMDKPEFQKEYTLEIENTEEQSGVIIIVQKDCDDKEKVLVTLNLNDKGKYNENVFTHKFITYAGAKSFNIYVISESLNSAKEKEKVEVHDYTKPNLILRAKHTSSVSPAPTISYNQVNPTKYTIRLEEENYRESFNLQLNQTYSPHWKLFAARNGKYKKLPEKYHFLGNFYNNSWHIDTKFLENTEYFVIEFQFQKVFYYGLGLSILTIITLSTLSVTNYLKKEKHAK